MSKRVIFIEHDHVSEGGPIWHQFKVRGYEITRFVIVDKEHQKSPNVTVQWPDLHSFDVVVVMGAPYAAYGDDVVGNWLLPELEKMTEVFGNLLNKYVKVASHVQLKLPQLNLPKITKL